MYVSDSNNNRVLHPNAPGTPNVLATLTRPARNQFDAAGDLYVGSLDGTVHKLSAGTDSDTDIATLAGSGIFGIVVDPNGNPLRRMLFFPGTSTS